MGKVLLQGVIYYRCFSNIARQIPQGAKIMHFCEMQIWEKALNVACAKRKDILRVGLQHTIVPLLLLNYFNYPAELQGDDFINSVPRPNRIGCVGPITEDILSKSGWKKEQLFILGGFRFGDLALSQDIGLVPPAKRKKQIVVAFSLSPFENREIIRLLFDAFNDKKTDYRILLKGHPCDPLEETVRMMGLNLNPGVFEFTNTSLSQIVPESMGMVVKESSSCFWALRNNIPVIVPLLYSIIDLCPLSTLSKSVIYVHSPQEIYAAVEEVMQGVRHANAQEGAKFLDNYLNIYLKKSEYYQNIISNVSG
jgi:surface carbohydrate biosynthesis protein (TIGR04326 family)